MRLLYFAWVRQKTGVSEETLALPPEVETLRDLAAHLARRHPDGFGDLSRLRAAVNQEHASWDAAVADDDEIAFFPPVTGG